MDVLFFFLGIVVICLTGMCCVVYAIHQHHEREMYRIRVREDEVHQMFLLNTQMIERRMLPARAEGFEEMLAYTERKYGAPR